MSHSKKQAAHFRKKSSPLRRFSKTLVVILCCYILLHVLVYALQEKFIFLEKNLRADHRYQFESVDFEEHFLSMKNGDQVNALYFKTKDSLKGTILYFHGNADNLDRWGNNASSFTDRGYHVFMIDYRGYGKSDGKPSETKLYEDGQKAYDWIIKKTSAQDLIIYGRSLGGGIASQIAASNPSKMLILETPFNEIRDVVQTRYPFLILKFPFRHRFLNHQKISKIDCPIHIFHGTKDKIVPFSCAVKLKNYFKPKDHFYTIEGGRHSNLNEFPVFKTTLDHILK